ARVLYPPRPLSLSIPLPVSLSLSLSSPSLLSFPPSPHSPSVLSLPISIPPLSPFCPLPFLHLLFPHSSTSLSFTHSLHPSLPSFISPSLLSPLSLPPFFLPLSLPLPLSLSL